MSDVGADLDMTLEISDLDMELAEISLVPDLRKCAILLDIDGTILDLAPCRSRFGCRRDCAARWRGSTI